MYTLMPPSTPKCSLFFVLHYRIWFNLDNISFIYVACGHKFFLITSEPAPKAQRHRQLPAAFIRVFPYQCVLLNVGVGASSRSRNQSRCAAANLPAAQRAAAAALQQLLLARAQDGAGAALARDPWLWNLRFLQVAHASRL